MTREEEDAIEEEEEDYEAIEEELKAVSRRIKYCEAVYMKEWAPKNAGVPPYEYICLMYDVVFGDRRVQVEAVDLAVVDDISEL